MLERYTTAQIAAYIAAGEKVVLSADSELLVLTSDGSVYNHRGEMVLPADTIRAAMYTAQKTRTTALAALTAALLGEAGAFTSAQLEALNDLSVAQVDALAGLSAVKLAALASNLDVVARDGSTAPLKVVPINGITLIAGGTGIADMTLAAPAAGSHVVIRIASITSGNVVIKTPAGVTFDGTNNTATFNAAEDLLELVYKSATEWAIVRSNSVTLSST